MFDIKTLINGLENAPEISCTRTKLFNTKIYLPFFTKQNSGQWLIIDVDIPKTSMWEEFIYTLGDWYEELDSEAKLQGLHRVVNPQIIGANSWDAKGLSTIAAYRSDIAEFIVPIIRNDLIAFENVNEEGTLTRPWEFRGTSVINSIYRLSLALRYGAVLVNGDGKASLFGSYMTESCPLFSIKGVSYGNKFKVPFIKPAALPKGSIRHEPSPINEKSYMSNFHCFQ